MISLVVIIIVIRFDVCMSLNCFESCILQIKPLVKPTRDIVEEDNLTYSWHDFVSESKAVLFCNAVLPSNQISYVNMHCLLSHVI